MSACDGCGPVVERVPGTGSEHRFTVGEPAAVAGMSTPGSPGPHVDRDRPGRLPAAPGQEARSA
ncbi:hypothetical protein [Streptomyces acidiscabies]|uniref:Uncharacterized protein n=1 Tax=Streptomyces acidiscabies TaxID=42234 RepID=A0AAP6BBS5_9ACTN|nr:hypothetical protein [Streptomyces acidiscabies]MBP5942662.1 hypothetical protein [Streptomyces sp. LBUM 1476]MBZ3917875.1 hypothetical protein [Streptomyces acidiscabies]MDX2961845.1 hypothetical protein [Streptomyces acidiscabies]MDX3023408.1 hypothetical protein [Streptomyces acidiscabies]MDX3789386.1 hypothetical protein [Streptomyces acidiscabies]